MEEKKKNAPAPLSYDELKAKFGELYQQYQKLVAEYQRAMEALQDKDFNYTSFFLQMLFKVVEHPEMYKDEFVSWCTENIEAALTSFAESAKKSAGAEEEPKNEAE